MIPSKVPPVWMLKAQAYVEMIEERYGQERMENEAERFEIAKRRGLIPKEFFDRLSTGDYNSSHAILEIAKWMEKVKATGKYILILCGPPGSGRTFCGHYLSYRYGFERQSAQHVFDTLSSYKNRYADPAEVFPSRLVIDGLGLEYRTQESLHRFDAMFDGRHDHKVPTALILESESLSEKEFTATYGRRFAFRVMENCTVVSTHKGIEGVLPKGKPSMTKVWSLYERLKMVAMYENEQYDSAQAALQEASQLFGEIEPVNPTRSYAAMRARVAELAGQIARRFAGHHAI